MNFFHESGSDRRVPLNPSNISSLVSTAAIMGPSKDWRTISSTWLCAIEGLVKGERNRTKNVTLAFFNNCLAINLFTLILRD